MSTLRQNEILQLARQKGHVDVELLSSHFDVSPQTIRKDLNLLCDTNALERTHGGAMLPSATQNLAYQARQNMAPEAKRAIGRAVAERIPNGASLILNIGTTTEQVAHALRDHHGLMVITNNLNVANILAGNAQIELIITAGTVRPSDRGIVGASTTDMLRQFKVDHAIIGTSALDKEGNLLDYDFHEVDAARAIIDNARETILVADHEKFNRNAPVKIANIREVTTFITDQTPPNTICDQCALASVKLIVTDNMIDQYDRHCA